MRKLKLSSAHALNDTEKINTDWYINTLITHTGWQYCCISENDGPPVLRGNVHNYEADKESVSLDALMRLFSCIMKSICTIITMLHLKKPYESHFIVCKWGTGCKRKRKIETCPPSHTRLCAGLFHQSRTRIKIALKESPGGILRFHLQNLILFDDKNLM